MARTRLHPRGAAPTADAAHTAPAADTALQRAARLGHSILGPRPFASPPAAGVQRYFSRQDLPIADRVPYGARISENLNLVVTGRQSVYAAPDKIRDANNILSQGSKIVLDAGEKADFNLALPPEPNGFSEVSLVDHYRVVPRYNPGVQSLGGDVPRDYSPEQGGSRQETEQKHAVYERELAQLGVDYSQFMEEVRAGSRDRGYAESFGGPASLDGTDWYREANSWATSNELRSMVLKLSLNDIAGAYMVDGDLQRRASSLRKLGDALAQFIGRELSRPDRIALPTDCGQVVRYIVQGGQPVQNDRLDHNPAIGSNYYTALPKNQAGLGWQYHWAGMILKDGGDNVTLESAGGTSLGSLGKDSWWMEMYGTRNVDQTFKKRLHQFHVLRNRDMLAGQDPSPTKTRAEQQLEQQQQTIDSWTRLDSDQG